MSVFFLLRSTNSCWKKPENCTLIINETKMVEKYFSDHKNTSKFEWTFDQSCWVTRSNREGERKKLFDQQTAKFLVEFFSDSTQNVEISKREVRFFFWKPNVESENKIPALFEALINLFEGIKIFRFILSGLKPQEICLTLDFLLEAIVDFRNDFNLAMFLYFY